jgi:hypothetical protein
MYVRKFFPFHSGREIKAERRVLLSLLVPGILVLCVFTFCSTLPNTALSFLHSLCSFKLNRLSLQPYLSNNSFSTIHPRSTRNTLGATSKIDALLRNKRFTSGKSPAGDGKAQGNWHRFWLLKATHGPKHIHENRLDTLWHRCGYIVGLWPPGRRGSCLLDIDERSWYVLGTWYSFEGAYLADSRLVTCSAASSYSHLHQTIWPQSPSVDSPPSVDSLTDLFPFGIIP